MNFREKMDLYYQREKEVIDALDRKQIEETMEFLFDAYEKGKTIYVFGNGGSSSAASHMVCDFNKGVCSEVEKRFNLICLNDNLPTLMAVANDMAFEDVFYYQLENKLKRDDIVLAISGSGNSKNIIKAVTYAKKVGAKVIGMTGYDGGKLYPLSDYHLHAPVMDMQLTEDMHMVFIHMMMRCFWLAVMEKEGKEPIYKINK